MKYTLRYSGSSLYIIRNLSPNVGLLTGVFLYTNHNTIYLKKEKLSIIVDNF